MDSEVESNEDDDDDDEEEDQESEPQQSMHILSRVFDPKRRRKKRSKCAFFIDPFRLLFAAQSPPVLEAMSELSAVANEIPDIRRLLDRVATRLAGQSMGRLDTLLLQVLLARYAAT